MSHNETNPCAVNRVMLPPVDWTSVLVNVRRFVVLTRLQRIARSASEQINVTQRNQSMCSEPCHVTTILTRLQRIARSASEQINAHNETNPCAVNRVMLPPVDDSVLVNNQTTTPTNTTTNKPTTTQPHLCTGECQTLLTRLQRIARSASEQINVTQRNQSMCSEPCHVTTS
ncbi:hypothetical protein J6590_023187 [Homalodisca vitripennis]|nr:hypothetical protein J6590_023187 [Homalodisca vitripennis]